MIEACILLSIWGLWCAFNVGMFLLGAVQALPHRSAYFNGFRVVIPAGFAEKLTQAELAAVIAHERGHQKRGHIWYNLLRVCVFAPVTPEERIDQELEADDCVGDELSLASALRKTSTTGQDLFRAERLERRWALKGSQDASNPTPGTGEKCH